MCVCVCVCAVVTQMTGSAHRTYTKVIKYPLRITSLQSGRVKYPFRFKKCVILRTFGAFSSTVYIMKF